MPCLFVLLALAAPRLVVVVLWFATNWFRGIFPSVLWPVLGFVFLPTTMLWYTAVQHWFGGNWTLWPIVGLVVALAIDVSPASRAPGAASRTRDTWR
jgi:hypothetical protein